MKTIRIALINATGGKAEREKLHFSGDQAGRPIALITKLIQDYGDFTVIGFVGLSSYQLESALTSHMSARGYICIISDDYTNKLEKWRYTQLTCLFVKREFFLKPLRYDEKQMQTPLRYAAAELTDGTIVRLLHVPCVDNAEDKKRYDQQLQRKQSYLEWEKELEQAEIALGGKRVIVFGDYNCSYDASMICHEEFEALPFSCKLDTPTWNESNLDHVFASPSISESVEAEAIDLLVGCATDHKTIIINLKGDEQND